MVLFFTDPTTGHRHGYYDGWADDGLFHYVGEGQRGDQRLVQGNRAILNHRADGRTLEGFRADGTSVTYLGEFELVGHYFTDAHETGEPDTLRQVVVFKLRPLREVPVELPRLPISPTSAARTDVVSVEEQHTERAFVSSDREPYELERREAGLVQRYREFLEHAGHEVGRLRIVPPGETRPLYSDLWDETASELIEAKSTVTRDQLRLAVGQLLDYGRFVDAKCRSVLVPSRPAMICWRTCAAWVLAPSTRTAMAGNASAHSPRGRTAPREWTNQHTANMRAADGGKRPQPT